MNQDRIKELFIYDPDTGVFTTRVSRGRWKNGDIAGTKHCGGYIQIGVDQRHYLAHRLAFLYMTGSFPPEQVDHINGDKADNRWENIRAVNGSQNMKNTSLYKNNTSGFCGVSWVKSERKWVVRISHGGVQLYLGGFSEISEAVEARKAAEKKFGYHKNHGRVL